MSKKLFSFLIIFGALVVFLPKGASADLGPKPSVDIDVVYNQQSISDTNFSARMLWCLSQDQKQVGMEDKTIPQLEINEYDSSKSCYWVPARLAGGGQCSNSSCHFGYMPPSEFKLAVFIPSIDKVFITNEISRTNFNSRYKAELFSDGSAKISETTPVLSSDKVSSFAKAFPITIILELLVSLIFLSVRKLPKKILTYILLANIISLPIVWFLFPLVKLPILAIIVMSEIFAVLFETYFIYLLNKQIITFKQSLTLNILNNLASLFVGGFIFGLLGIFGF
jgi:hypothetical protein